MGSGSYFRRAAFCICAVLVVMPPKSADAQEASVTVDSVLSMAKEIAESGPTEAVRTSLRLQVAGAQVSGARDFIWRLWG
jgi:hypothetical protein